MNLKLINHSLRWVFIFLVIPSSFIFSQEKLDFSKNGKVYNEVITIWDNYYKDYFAAEIDRRLFQQGDVYVLYDIQIGGLQSFLEMTRRTKDTQRIQEIVELLYPIFSKIEPLSDNSNVSGWICKGGRICTAYDFIGEEVHLCSVQFLGLVGALATNIIENIPLDKRSKTDILFIDNTFNALASQINRWLSDDYFASVKRRLAMSPTDVKSRSSKYFFTDKDLWHLTVLSDLSELIQYGIQTKNEEGEKAINSLFEKKENIANIFDLFLSRSFIFDVAGGSRAEIDRGYWRLYYDNRFSNYIESKSPVKLEKDEKGNSELVANVIWDSSYIAPGVGWDISHARRLVPALETFVRNHDNIKTVWGYDNPDFDPEALRLSYANQIVDKIWNNDERYPLFTNYWSGDNGWYRVAYGKHVGRQFMGYSPFGLTISMTNGGYPIWGANQPVLKNIFMNIFQLIQSNDEDDKSFVKKYYNGISKNSSKVGSLEFSQSLSFLSDLIEID